MADVKISALPASTTPLAGTEVLPIVQSSTTKQVSVANLTAGRAVSASSLTLTTPLGVASGGTGLTSLTAGYIPYGNGTGAFGVSTIYTDGVNIGVGRSNPSAKLDVYGTIQTLSNAAGGGYLAQYNALNAASRTWKITNDIAVYGDFGIQQSTTQTGSTFATQLYIDASGNVVINTAAIATNATDGFLYVPTCAGTPTGTPTTYTGRAPIVVNTTDNKLYFYSGGAWRDAGP